MFKTILYLWVLLTISLFGITIWFLINTIKKRFVKTKKIEEQNQKYNQDIKLNKDVFTEKQQDFKQEEE